MAVIATPAPGPQPPCCQAPGLTPGVPASVDCNEQHILSAPVSRVNGQPLLSRMQAISVMQGQCATIDWTLHNRAGQPIDLTSCGYDSDGAASISSSLSLLSATSAGLPTCVVLRIREHLSIGYSCEPAADVVMAVVDKDNGKVKATLPPQYTKHPGVYFAEVALVTDVGTAAECVLVSNIFYLIVNRGLHGYESVGGPPSIMEIRLHLRDSHPSENFLIDNLKFDDAEIALAIQRPVQYWNDVPPDIGRHTTADFPYRYFWLEAIAGNLFLIAEEHFRANNLSYSAAGVSVDDMDKEKNYAQAAQRRLDEWRGFVRVKKASLNLESCYGSVGSPYGRYAY